eukprot:4606198-Amphidinium_carterae.2
MSRLSNSPHSEHGQRVQLFTVADRLSDVPHCLNTVHARRSGGEGILCIVTSNRVSAWIARQTQAQAQGIDADDWCGNHEADQLANEVMMLCETAS